MGALSCRTDNMAEEEGEGLELMDLLLQGLLLLELGWGMAEEDGRRRTEVEQEMLPVTGGDIACSVITDGCEVTPSEDSGMEKRGGQERREEMIGKKKGGEKRGDDRKEERRRGEEKREESNRQNQQTKMEEETKKGKQR